MATTTVSSKFQIVIPKETRKKLNLNVGQKLEIIEFNNRIELIPVLPAKEFKGFLPQLDFENIRDKSDRL